MLLSMGFECATKVSLVFIFRINSYIVVVVIIVTTTIINVVVSLSFIITIFFPSIL